MKLSELVKLTVKPATFLIRCGTHGNDVKLEVEDDMNGLNVIGDVEVVNFSVASFVNESKNCLIVYLTKEK